VTFSALFAPYALFNVVQAPIFIWLAVVGLVVGTFIVFMRLQSLVRREQHLYQRLARDLRTIEAMNCLPESLTKRWCNAARAGGQGRVLSSL
jgi:hypothetical protein